MPKRVRARGELTGIFDLATDEARKEGAHAFDTEHLLLASLVDGRSVAAEVLAWHGVTEEVVRTTIVQIRRRGS